MMEHPNVDKEMEEHHAETAPIRYDPNDWVKKLVIIGAGGFGRECAQIAQDIYLHDRSIELLGYLDDDPNIKGKMLNGYKILGDLNWIKIQKNKEIYFVCGIGDPKKRKEITLKAIGLGYIPITLIHPKTIIFSTEIGVGVVIQPGTCVAVNAKIGDHVHLNFNAIVGHDAIVEDYCTFAPTAQTMGYSYLREGVYLGVSAVVKQGIRIGSYSTLGALSFANKNIPDNVVMVGSPAKLIKKE